MPCALTDHPLGRLIDLVAGYLGVAPDASVGAWSMSTLTACIGAPVNLAVISPDIGSDLILLRHLASALPAPICEVNYALQLHQARLRGFGRMRFILVQGVCQPWHLFVRACEATARPITPLGTLPVMWTVATTPAPGPVPGPTLVLPIAQGPSPRSLAGLAEMFAGWPRMEGRRPILQQLESIFSWSAPRLRCDLLGHIRLPLTAMQKELVLRSAMAAAALRAAAEGLDPEVAAITRADYAAVRALLSSLPLDGESRLSPRAVDTAHTLHDRVSDPSYCLVLPDRAAEGPRWFDRLQGVEWTGLSYNTVKSHLTEMEKDGLVISTRAESNRGRGKHIFYRFIDGRRPPFGRLNPYTDLPEL
jgi:hypothetical protein